MNKLHDFRKYVMATFSKYTSSQEVLQSFCVQEVIHSLLQVLARNFGAPKFLHVALCRKSVCLSVSGTC